MHQWYLVNYVALAAAICSCKASPSQTSSSSGKKAETSAPIAAVTVMAQEQTLNRCTGAPPSPLARWKSGTSELGVSYCLSDSIDSEGIGVFSRLDVWQEDLATGAVAFRFHDEVGRGLVSIKMFRPAFALLDVDHNGTNETFFGYYYASEGLDPVRIKFVAHMDGAQYAAQGELPRIDDDLALFKVDLEQAFAAAPPQLKQAAKKLFREFIIALCTDPDLGLGLPVPPQIAHNRG